MFLNLALFFVLLCLLETSLGVAQHCSTPCVEIDKCPSALAMLNNTDSRELLRSAFCGFSTDAASRPTVCCPRLSPKMALEDHPNMRLLPVNCGLAHQHMSMGDEFLTVYEFPWLVMLAYHTRDGLDFQCSGGLINNRYVLTAAHCIEGLRLAGARVGEHDHSTSTHCKGDIATISCESRIQDFGIEEVIPHEEYSPKPHVRNDIGLLRLKKPVDLTPKNVRPICLPTSMDLRSRSLGGINATLAGWSSNRDRTFSPGLLKVIQPILTDNACKILFNSRWSAYSNESDKKLCTGHTGGDPCGGDSGSPLMVPGMYQGRERYIQQGIVSYGPRPCGFNFPGIYTEVAPYMKWILDHMKP